MDHMTVQPTPGSPKKPWWKELTAWLGYLALWLLAALLIKTLVFEPVWVKGRSMAETLQNGEVMIATKYDYLLGDPQRFDVVICHYPQRTEYFVKRIAGIPGDTVQVKDGLLYVNGEAQEESYITYPPTYQFGPYTVGPEEYFVLGDNRASSNDSHLVGPLSRGQIVGHVQWVIFPLNAIRPV